MLRIKFDEDWPTDLEHNQLSRARISDVTDPIRPEFELVRNFMPVLVTSKIDKGLIKNERVSLETPFPHYKSMVTFLTLKET